MSQPSPHKPSPHAGLNRLLAGLPSADRDQLSAAIRIEHPARGQTLAIASKAGADVWIPHQGIVALSSTDEDGHSAQTGVVGAEGCVGLEALLDDTVPPMADAAVQIEGDMSVIPARALRSALRTKPLIREALVKYLYGLSAQSMRIVACNRLHTLEQRCCTWLLVIQDRIGADELPLTQDSLAGLLGGGRPRINRTLAKLESSGLLRRGRGRIRLVNRPGLERRACECFNSIFRAFNSLGITAYPR